MKSSSTAFRFFQVETLGAMGYRPSYADPYLLLQPEVKPDYYEYYEYILCYVDDVLCISHNLRKLMKRIQEYFNLKDNKIGPPGLYLGSKISNMKLESVK